MAKSIKWNFVLNTINTTSKVLFPLLTFPYAARILQPDGMGEVGFFNSIITYITLFTSIGIPLYSIREVAKVRDDLKTRNIIVLEILCLHLILTTIGYCVVAILCFYVPEINHDYILFLILSLTLLFSAIGCEWFYQGVEDFFYITLRGLVVKSLSIIFLFIFVKTKSDLYVYGVYCVFGTVGGNIFNFLRLRRYVKIDSVLIRQLKPFRHLKPALKIFVLNLAVSIYLQLNIVMLGFINGSEAVGFYTAATKLMSVVLCISNSLGPVVMPRMSNLIAEKKVDEYKSLAQKAYNFAILISLPFSVGLFFVSPYAIRLLCGEMYLPSITASRIVSPIIFVVCLSGFMGTQFLYPLGKVKLMIISTAIGGVVTVLLNTILIPLFSYDGASVSYLCAEITVSLSMYLLAKKMLPIAFVNRSVKCCFCGAFLLACVLFFVSRFNVSAIASLLIMIVVGGMTYMGVLLLLKEDFSMQLLTYLEKCINHFRL